MPKSVAISEITFAFQIRHVQDLLGQPKRTQTAHPHPQGTYKQDSIRYPYTDESALIGALEALPTRIVSNWSGNRNIEYEAGRGTIGASMVLQRPPHPPPRYSKVVCIRERGSMGRHARPGLFLTL